MIPSTSLLVALGAALSVAAQDTYTINYANPMLAKVLLYTYTDGFRHDSIPTAIKELQKWGPYYNVSFDATEDQSKISAANLAQYDAIMCVHTTGNFFSAAGQTGFQDFINKGGNFVGVHAAAAGYLEKPWAPYTQTLGATFDHHPKRQNATFMKLAEHDSTDCLQDTWIVEEEVYSFTSDPRKLGAQVVLSVDDSTYKDSGYTIAQGKPHPIAWYQDYAAGAVVKPGVGAGIPGRSYYTSMGHLNETWQNATFIHHVMGGLTWTFASNTTRVAQGLYAGQAPTIHTGATNNATGTGVAAWSATLGSNATAPPPPPPLTPASPTPSSSAPEASGSSGSSSSGASILGVASWSIVLASLGAVFGAVSL